MQYVCGGGERGRRSEATQPPKEKSAMVRTGHLNIYLVPLNDGRIDGLQFYVIFNSISVISGRWTDDNERLCAMGSRLRLRKFRLERGSNSGPLDQ